MTPVVQQVRGNNVVYGADTEAGSSGAPVFQAVERGGPLTAVALHHEAKVKVRLVPTREEFVERFGRRPRLLDEVLAETH